MVAAFHHLRFALALDEHRTPNTREQDGEPWRQARAPLVDGDLVLQSETHHWLRGLSRAVHPVQLCRHYPRLANRLASTWRDAELTERLLQDLMIDRRGGRRGFAPRIAAEITRLHRYHAVRLAADRAYAGRHAADAAPTVPAAFRPVASSA